MIDKVMAARRSIRRFTDELPSRAQLERLLDAAVLVADRLARKSAEVTAESRLVDDLGADSLDFVDLVFAIEKRFGVKLRDDELDVLFQLDFSSPEVMREGFLTRGVIERLTPALPALREVADPERVTPAAVFGLITVGTLCDMVTRKLAGSGG